MGCLCWPESLVSQPRSEGRQRILRASAGSLGHVSDRAGVLLWCSCRRPPVSLVPVQAEAREAGQVVGGGEQVEVGGYACDSSHASSPAAVSSPHEVPELAFDLGSGRSVVGGAVGLGLAPAVLGEFGFVEADADLAAVRRAGAKVAQRAGGARFGEPGLARFLPPLNGDGDLVRAGDRVVLQVDLEVVLGEMVAWQAVAK